MKIYIMRHGPAEDHARSGRDFDRKLTASGRARTELVAQELGQREEQPRHTVSGTRLPLGAVTALPRADRLSERATASTTSVTPGRVR